MMQTIRDARPQDLEPVLGLLESVDLPREDVPPIFGECFVVAIYNDSIVGVAGIQCVEDIGLFRSAGVRADQRGKGIGDALTRNRIEWAKSHGLAELYLLTISASEYFERYGFETISRSDVPAPMLATYEFTVLCPNSATVMRLKLAS